MISNGKGYCKCYLIEVNLREEGKVVEGVRDSVWRGFSNDSLLLIEHYEMGLLKQGIRYHVGKEYSYSAFEQAAEFKGGIDAMSKTISTIINYPADARRMGVEGMVLVSFIVDSVGILKNAKILNGVSRSIDKEALRAVNTLKNWIPGTQRGKPISVSFVYPIDFKLDK